MLGKLILFAGFSGITVFIGGLLAKRFYKHDATSPLKFQISHTLTAFGGGIILSAVALILIPTGLAELPPTPLIISFVAGALIFFLIDRALARRGGKTASLLAMLMDYIPESIALGATFACEYKTALLLSIFIGLQNLPEAFNAFGDLKKSGFKGKTIIIIFFFLSFSGILGALFGFKFLTDLPGATAKLMIFASGGILYLLFQDIIPDSQIKNSHTVSLGAVAGFLVGLLGKILV